MTLAEAVQEALENHGTSVLSNPTLFRNFLMDYLDENSPELRVLRYCCDERLLAPIAKALESGEDMQGVIPRVEYYLTSTCMIKDEVSHSIASGLVEGVRLYAAGEDGSSEGDEEEEKPLFLLSARAESMAAPDVSAWTCTQGVKYQLDSRALHKGCTAVLRMVNTRYTNVTVRASLVLASGECRVQSAPLVPGGQGILAFGARILELESLEVLATGDTSPSHCLAWHVAAGDGHSDAGKTYVRILNLSGVAVRVRDVLLEESRSQGVARADVPCQALGPRESMRMAVPRDLLEGTTDNRSQQVATQAGLRVYVNGARILADANAPGGAARGQSSSASGGVNVDQRASSRGAARGLRFEVVNDWVQPHGSSLLFLRNDSWNVLSARVHVRSRSAWGGGVFDRRMTIGPMAPAEERVAVLPVADAQVVSLSATDSGGELFSAWCFSWNDAARRREVIWGQTTLVTRFVVDPPEHVGTAMVVSKEDKKLWMAAIDTGFAKHEGFQLVVAGELHDPRVYIDGVGIERNEKLGPSLRTKGIWGHHENMVRQMPVYDLPLWRMYGAGQ